MSSMKFGSRYAFDLKVRDGSNDILFTVETGTITEIKGNGHNNVLIIKDALVNTDLINDFISGKYDGKSLFVLGETVFRSLEDQKDYTVLLHINEATFKKVEFQTDLSGMEIHILFNRQSVFTVKESE